MVLQSLVAFVCLVRIGVSDATLANSSNTVNAADGSHVETDTSTQLQEEVLLLSSDGSSQSVLLRDGHQHDLHRSLLVMPMDQHHKKVKSRKGSRPLLRSQDSPEMALAEENSYRFGDVLTAHSDDEPATRPSKSGSGHIGNAINVLKKSQIFLGALPDGTEDYMNFYDNYKGNFGGAFSVAFAVRFDEIVKNSRIIDFGNGPGQDNIVVGRAGTSDDLEFSIYRREILHGEIKSTNKSLFASKAIVTGSSAKYLCVVDALGRMRMYRNGVTIAEREDGFPPEQVPRLNLFVGKSNWPEDGMLKGKIFNLRIWNYVVPWKIAHPIAANKSSGTHMPKASRAT